jgi:2-isopropylmalate synthase
LRIAIHDATVTEGAREAGVELSVRDKLRIVLRLSELGIAWVEGGWPDAGGADAELFREARRLDTGKTRLCACAALGPGRRGSVRAALRSGAPAVVLSAPVGRGAGRLRDVEQVGRAVAAVREAGRTAIVDLDGFFDALRGAGGEPLAGVEAAAVAGAGAVLLSDTSGGALPHEIEAGVVAARRAARGSAVGIRARNDAGVAVANSLAAVGKGATVVVTTVNGYGERCGAADLAAVAAGLELKLRHQALEPGKLRQLSAVAQFVADLADRETPRHQPYVGFDAFALGKGGAPHVDPRAVGNRAEAALADERGHPDALRVARSLGIPARGRAGRVLARLAAWERRGFRYEGAEASFELLLRTMAGRRKPYFRVHAYRVLDLQREGKGFTEATAEISVAGERLHSAAMGVGPVNALDRALRRALEQYYPELADMELVQARSRNLGSGAGTAAVVRVHLESADGRDRWGTAGVSDNLIGACCQALVEAIEYKLLKDDVPVAAAPARRRRARR